MLFKVNNTLFSNHSKFAKQILKFFSTRVRSDEELKGRINQEIVDISFEIIARVMCSFRGPLPFE